MRKTFTLRNTLLMAMLIAISIILSRFLGFYLDPNSLRISFEAAPIILAGVWMGPVAGLVVGGIADLLGALVSGVAFTPFLMIGPMMIGFLSGLLSKYIFKDKKTILTLSASCIIAEFIGTMIVTTYILMLLYGGGTYTALFISRLPFKVITMIGNAVIVNVLNKLLYKKIVIKYLRKNS